MFMCLKYFVKCKGKGIEYLSLRGSEGRAISRAVCVFVYKIFVSSLVVEALLTKR